MTDGTKRWRWRAATNDTVGALRALGGTDLRVGITAAAQLRPRPDLVVVFSDGHTPWPHSAPPGGAVVVALLGREGSHLPPTPE